MRQRFNIPAGEYDLPVLAYQGSEGTEDPQFVRLLFGAADERPGKEGKLVLAFTLSTYDAAAVLHGLQFLQGKGLIPIVPQVPTGKQ